MTPGIIPRQREKLAHSIARMVSRNLFNAEVIIGHIRSPHFQETLQHQLSELFAPTTLDGAPANAAEAAKASANQQAEQAEQAEQDPSLSGPVLGSIDRVEQFILPLLQAPLNRKFILRLIQRYGKPLGARKLDSLIPAGLRDLDNLTELCRRLIEGKNFRRTVGGLVLWLKKQESDNVPLSRFFTRPVMDTIFHLLEAWYQPFIKAILSFLRRPDINRELIKRGKIILSDILLKLNPMQRIMITTGQYDRTLGENMPAIIADLIRVLEETLRTEKNRETILTTIHGFLVTLLDKGLRDLGNEYNLHLSRSAYRLFAWLQTILIQEDLAGLLAKQISKRQEISSVDTFLQYYGKLTFSDLLMKLYQLAIDWIDDVEKRTVLKEKIAAGILQSKREKVAPQHLAEEDAIIIGTLSNALSSLIEGAVPVLVEQFNIYQMVVDRINALDVEEVEGLLLGIIASHLKYINILGAVLGALIGVGQLLLSIFSR